jgi:hypothetical protein
MLITGAVIQSLAMRRGAMTARLFAIACLAIALGAPGFAQESSTPDLSGTWRLNLEKSKIAKHSPIGSETLVIKCAGNSIHVASTLDGKESTEMYVVDGKEHVDLSVPGAGQWHSKAQWKKSVLITEFVGRVKGIDGGDFEILHNTHRWTLSPGGRSLAERVSTSVDVVPDQLFVYDMQ